VLTSKFKHVDHAERVVRQVKHRVCVADDDRWLGARVANQLNPARQSGKILDAPYIAMDECDPILLQSLDIGFAASTYEIIHGHYVIAQRPEV
jgi:hypothetical protein